MRRDFSAVLAAGWVLWCGLGCGGAHASTGVTQNRAEPELRRFEFVRQKLGGPFRIVLYARDQGSADKAADAGYTRVDALNTALSDYDAEGEISRLSQRSLGGPMAEPVVVSDDLWRVLERGQELARLTDGAFDVTVGPFMRLWRRSRDLRELPTQERLDQMRRSVGHHHLRLDPRKRTAQLMASRMRLDVGGLALGYIADETVAAVSAAGAPSVLVDAGGEISVGDAPPGRRGWRVAVQSLKSPEETTGRYVEVARACVTTSGDTRRFVEIGGRRYSHIIDPRTGLGLTRRIGATIICRDGMTADALDTAVCVLGPEKGLELIERTAGAAGQITTIEGDEVKVFESRGFKNFLVDRDGATEMSAERR